MASTESSSGGKHRKQSSSTTSGKQRVRHHCWLLACRGPALYSHGDGRILHLTIV